VIQPANWQSHQMAVDLNFVDSKLRIGGAVSMATDSLDFRADWLILLTEISDRSHVTSSSDFPWTPNFIRLPLDVD